MKSHLATLRQETKQTFLSPDRSADEGSGGEDIYVAPPPPLRGDIFEGRGMKSQRGFRIKRAPHMRYSDYSIRRTNT